LVVIDEVQKVPSLLDVVQDAIDRRLARFVLSGSSARRLRHGANVNLLPGRVVALRLDPLALSEHSTRSLEQHLFFGDLPGVATTEDHSDCNEDLRSYVVSYLDAEVRAEAMVRNLGAFARFLELAASESGHVVNLRRLSRQLGIAHTTVAAHYQILEDCLIGERIGPLLGGPRKKLVKSHKWLLFDMGVRRVAAGEGVRPTRERLGELFEQYVGLELLRCLRVSGTDSRLHFWRDADGPEIDWVIKREDGELVPIEVKWTSSPIGRDIRHLLAFQRDYPRARQGYLVCRISRPALLAPGIKAWPWQRIDEIVFEPE